LNWTKQIGTPNGKVIMSQKGVNCWSAIHFLFVDKGLGGAAPSGYKKIQYQMTYNIKHDSHNKARLVAGGHLTDPNTESINT
jgi:hypothetical protein